MKKNKKYVFLSLLILGIATSVYGMKHYYGRQLTNFHFKDGRIRTKPQVLTQEEKIRTIIKQNLKDIQECYNQRIENGLEKNGKLRISWDINEIGIPSNFIESDNQLNDMELFDCSSHAISKWRFPEGIYYKINYTFNLKQKDRKTASAEEMRKPLEVEP